jgi:RHS repeat-associated protein
LLANNLAPNAYIVLSGSSLTGKTSIFNGLYSNDPDGGSIAAYEWAVDGIIQPGSTEVLGVFKYVCTLAEGQTSRTATIRLRVKDEDNGGTWSSYVYKTITISAVNRTEYYLSDHLGSIRTTIDQTGTEIGYDDFDPFGNILPGRSYNAGTPNDLNKFTGHERDQEGGLDLDYMLARNYDSEWGRFYSVDPMFQYSSPYIYVGNNPLLFTDPTGMLGDYYNSDGNLLGNDGIVDDKVYNASSVIKNDKGVVTSAEGSTLLEITHTEFRKQASTVYGESSAYKLSTVTDDLKKEMFAIASVHQKNKKAYGANSENAIEYLALTPSQINSSKFKTTANAAVINALTGGFDYSYGAKMWDGAEQGIFPATNNDRSIKYNGKNFELHMNTMGWSIFDSHFKTWKANVCSAFQAPQQKSAPANFGNYSNKGLMSLESTVVFGQTIFWKVIN